MTAIIVIVIIVGLIYLSHVIQKKQIEQRQARQRQQEIIDTTPIELPTKQFNDVSIDNSALRYEELSVVGVTYDNSDGTNRQDILKMCKSGTKIELRRTPMRKYPNAIGVFTKYGQIGNISEDDNEEIARSMDAGYPIQNAKIKKLVGGTVKKPNIGCIISFEFYDE